MDDNISRQAAIDALRYAQHRFTVADEASGMGTVKWSEYVIYFAAAERVLTELPSANAVQGWTPCSERLPESGEYLTTVIWTGATGRKYRDLEQVELKRGEWLYDGEVIAWQPLPETYKGGDTDAD